MSDITYCLATEGPLRLQGAMAESAADSLDPCFEDAHWRQDPQLPRSQAVLVLPETPRSYGLGEIVGGVTLFIGAWFTKKLLDELHDRLLKRPLGAFLDRLFRTGAVKAGGRVEIRDVVYLADIDLTVVVHASVDAGSAAATAALFLQAHRVAHAFIEQHGRLAPVHCHAIEDGRVALEPELFQALAEQDRAARARQIPPR